MMSTSTVNSSLLRFVIILLSASNHGVDIVTLTSASNPLTARSSANLETTAPATQIPSDRLITATTLSAVLVPTFKPSATLVTATTTAFTAADATTPSATLVSTTTSPATLVLTKTPSATLVSTTTLPATLVLTKTPSATLVSTATSSATLIPTTTQAATIILTPSASLDSTTGHSATRDRTTKSSATLVSSMVPLSSSTTQVPTTSSATVYASRHTSETPAPTTASFSVPTISLFVVTGVLILENTLIIVVIRKTKYLRSHTGALLINQTCSDIVFYIALMCQFFPKNASQNDSYRKMKETCYIVSTGLIGVTIITFTAMSCNLYVAVCHSNFYRKHMKKLYVSLFIVITWFVNLSLPFTRLANFMTRTNPNSGDIIFVYAPRHAWSWIMCDISVYGIPPFINAFCYIKIWKYVRKIQPIPNSNINIYDKVKVTKFTSGASLCYILTSLFSHTFRVLYGTFEPWPDYVGPFQILWWSFNSFLFVYHFFKIVIYMLLYQPFRRTISLMSRNRNVSQD